METLNSRENKDFNIITVSFKLKTVAIALQGAHVISLVDQGKERLWVSPKSHFEQGKPIRGGIPVCWPWFGDADQPAHGVARTAQWRVSELEQTEERTRLFLEPSFSANESKRIPQGLNLKLRIILDQQGFCCALITTNSSQEVISFTEALHTYLPVSSLETSYVEGLEGTRYADKLDQYQVKADSDSLLYLNQPTDRIYFENSPFLDLVDKKAGLITRVEKRGSATTVLWNPGSEKAAAMSDLGTDQYQNFVCIEASNALNHSVTLDPNEVHELSQRLSWQDTDANY